MILNWKVRLLLNKNYSNHYWRWIIYYICQALMHLFYIYNLKPHSHPSEIGPVIPSFFQLKELVLLWTSHFYTLIPKAKLTHKKKTTDEYTWFISPAIILDLSISTSSVDVFWHAIVWCVRISGSYVILADRPFYHCAMSLFLLLFSVSFAPNSTLSVLNMSTPVFFLITKRI